MRVWPQLGHLRFILVLAAAILAFASLVHADPVDPTVDRPLADPAQESAARTLMREIRCVVCQSQSIDESDAEIAAQLRNVIREQIAAGKSDTEIRDYLTARYGDFVLLDPPFKSKTLILWLGPFVLAGVGLAGVLAMTRRRRGSVPAPGGFAPPDLSEGERRRLQALLAESEDQPPSARSGAGR